MANVRAGVRNGLAVLFAKSRYRPHRAFALTLHARCAMSLKRWASSSLLGHRYPSTFPGASLRIHASCSLVRSNSATRCRSERRMASLPPEAEVTPVPTGNPMRSASDITSPLGELLGHPG